MQKTIREYHGQLHENKLDNLEEMEVSRNIQPAKIESRKNLNRPMTRSEIESVKKKPPCKPKSRTTWLHWGILPNIQRRTYTYPSQTLPKD